jgi:transposase
MSQRIAVGADVSSTTIEVHVQTPGGRSEHFTVKNEPRGHCKMVRKLQGRGSPVRVCLEATGVYSLDVSLALRLAAGIRVMVLNPRVARRFAEALTERSKTDSIDAQSLSLYAERMPFTDWEAPRPVVLEVRTLARRIENLTSMRTQEKNRLSTVNATRLLEVVRNDIEVSIRHFDRRIARLQKRARDRILSDPRLAEAYRLLTSVRGIAETSAVRLLAELLVLPKDMKAKQWVAHAGLDPCHYESGTSVRRRSRISKRGNKHLRSALYMPAHTAIRFEPGVRHFHDRLLARGKTKMQAKVAVMRKLLVALHAMLRDQRTFDGSRFSSPALLNAA